MENSSKDSLINLNKETLNSNKEITADLTKEVETLHTLTRIKATLETSGIVDNIQNDIDLLLLNNFENEGLNKLKNEILDLYNSLEKEARTFSGIVYATIEEKKQAEKEYRDIYRLKKIAQSTLNINERKKILEKINSMGFVNKNIAPLLFEVDTACKTYNDVHYNTFEELEIALEEQNQLKEFIKLSEILDEKIQISAIINIKRKVSEIKKHTFINPEINKCIADITAKLHVLETEAKNFNGRHYSTLEEVQKVQDELYYIDTESYKFDMNKKEGLELFLELMSLKDFETLEAREKLNEYKNTYSILEKEYNVQLKVQNKKNTLIKKKKKLNIIFYSHIATIIALSISIAVFIASGNFISTAILVFFSILEGILFTSNIIYWIYYKTICLTNSLSDKIKSKFKK